MEFIFTSGYKTIALYIFYYSFIDWKVVTK